MTTPEDVWSQIRADVDLYKFYLDITLKGTAFVLAITGGILSYFLAHSDQGALRLSLAVPLVLNAGFVVLFLFSVAAGRSLGEEHEQHCKAVQIKAYDMRPLPAILTIFACLHLLVAAGLLILLFTGFPLGGR